MDKYYKFNSKIKKEMVTRWTNSQEEFKTRKRLAMTLQIVGVGICLILFLIFSCLASESTSNIPIPILGLFVGIVLGCIPFIIGHAIKSSGKRKYGAPYNEAEREFFRINGVGLQYGFHDTNSDFNESMAVYQIPFENMNGVYFNPEFSILTIVGEAELIAYDDMQTNRINHQLSQRRFYNNTPFEIMLSFDEQEEIITILQNRKKKWED